MARAGGGDLVMAGRNVLEGVGRHVRNGLASLRWRGGQCGMGCADRLDQVAGQRLLKWVAVIPARGLQARQRSIGGGPEAPFPLVEGVEDYPLPSHRCDERVFRRLPTPPDTQKWVYDRGEKRSRYSEDEIAAQQEGGDPQNVTEHVRNTDRLGRKQGKVHNERGEI